MKKLVKIFGSKTRSSLTVLRYVTIYPVFKSELLGNRRKWKHKQNRKAGNYKQSSKSLILCTHLFVTSIQIENVN